jgi:AAA domain, putative AbiEii toxin, Type IV TA system/AAA ATPase domain
MITAIEIENFKGIRDRVRIELKPITLLFGANSSGKSTIIHALHYAREVFVRGNLDADRTETGGDFVDLGGFRNFVHGRDLNRRIVLRFEISLDAKASTMLPYFGRSSEQDYGDDTLLDRLDRVRSAMVTLKIAWSRFAGRPFVSEYQVNLDGEPFALITGNPEKPNAASLHVAHRGTCLHDETEWGDDVVSGEFEDLLGRVMPGLVIPDDPDEAFEIAIEARRDALPTFDGRLSCPTLFEDADPNDAVAVESFMNILSRAIVGPGKLVRDELEAMRYIGPLREKPPRVYDPPRFPEPSRWATGIAAWDHLYWSPATFIDSVSDWLCSSDKLDVGYRLERKTFREVDPTHPAVASMVAGHAFDDADLEELAKVLRTSPTSTKLSLLDNSTARLAPSDVGEGISQLIPVVVALLLEKRPITAIEQPELHIHPAIQVALGDLMIEASRSQSSPILIETHSEHLLLRLLRRIREASEGELPDGYSGLSPDRLSVCFLETKAVNSDESKRKQRIVVATQLPVDETGEFTTRWPRGFFDERISEV